MSADSQTVAVEEQRILDILDVLETELLEFTRQLIATPSVNPPGDERAVADLVQDCLARHGLSSARRVGADERRPNLLVDLGDPSPRTLILSGHLDTKPAGDEEAWETDPWDPVITPDGDLYGLGSGDMKAAVAAMTFAAIALADAAPDLGRLTLVFTADEEAGSTLGSKWLAENGLLAADAAIIGEPCGITREWEEIDIISRGAALFKVRVTGTQTHSSISDRLPVVNATVKMARLIDRMENHLLDELVFEPHRLVSKPTLNVGVTASAGVFYGVYPGSAEFACDLRTLPGMSKEQVIADLEGFLDRARVDDPELQAELIFEIWVPATEISPDEPVVASLQSAAATVLGKAPPLAAFPGATDAPHFQLTAGIPTVAAFGPGYLPRAHTPNEHLASKSVSQAARIYALAAWRYLGGQTGSPL